MANWQFSDEGQKLFEDKLKSIGWFSLSDSQLADQFDLDRSVVTKLRNGQQQGHRKTLERVMIALEEDADEVKSEAFARTYFQEVEDSPKSLSDKKLDSIDKQIKIQKLEQIAVENPFQPLKGRIEKSEQFFNREKELRDIFELLNAGSGVELLGDRQMGKSSLLQQVKYHAASALTVRWKPIYLNLQKVHSEGEFYETFCEELGIDNCKDIELNRAMRSRRVLLLLDETENLQGNGFTREIRDRLRAFAEDGSLRLVVAAGTPLDHLFPDSNEQGMTSPFQGICTRVELKSWHEETVQKFVVTRLENTGISFSETDMEKLWQESQGHPQKLMQACFELYRQYLENL